jgi:hypothetical protein
MDTYAIRPRIYVDMSAFGGCEDIESTGHSRRLVAATVNGAYSMVISEVTLLEMEKAPAAEYIHDGAVGKNERADALHNRTGPLLDGDRRDHAVGEVRRRLGHAAARTGRADAPAFPGEGHEEAVAAACAACPARTPGDC